MEINLRISHLIDKLGHNKSSFANQVGVSQPIITHITNGRNNPGLEVIQKILQSFPEVNPDWLIMGRGEVFLNNQLRIKMITDLLSDINEKIISIENEVASLKEKAILLENLIKE
ncbi:MAG: helix-turn-helix transcriptional regulator [Bacteroidota bacterium]|nr:helix-turn-helix transcriptional regulator [Bacteroidota bacterium]